MFSERFSTNKKMVLIILIIHSIKRILRCSPQSFMRENQDVDSIKDSAEYTDQQGQIPVHRRVEILLRIFLRLHSTDFN